MTGIFIIAVLIGGGFVVFALVRGLYHFSRNHTAAHNKISHDSEQDAEAAMHANHKMQNRMMQQRIKWQAIVILLLVLATIFAVAK